MIHASCSWNSPGSDRYSGTTAAAIHAYAEIPRATQDALIAKFERRDFDDFVVIDRDTITSAKGNYAGMSRMHFGANPANICDTIDRSGWTPQHTETALVVCAGGYCVAMPAVCGNWFILGALTPIKETPPAAAEVATLPGATTGPELPTTDLAMTVAPLTFGSGDDYEVAYGGSLGGFVDSGGGAGGGFLSPPCADCCVVKTPPVSPVPEPSTWLLVLAGLLAIFGIKRRRA